MAVTTAQEAAEKRRAALAGRKDLAAAQVPAGVRARETPPERQELHAAPVEKDGKSFLKLDGYASTYERKYTMWDFYGPYEEGVRTAAGAASLAAEPDTAFLINHRGLPLARSTNKTLDLSEDGTGLRSVSYMNPKRTEAADLYRAVQDGDVTEMSFAFTIERGVWSPDFTEFWIEEYNIDRGDTSAVTFGANPHTSIDAREARFAQTTQFMRTLDLIEGPALAAAHGRLAERLGAELAPARPGAGAVEGLRLLRQAIERGRLGAAERAVAAALLQRVEDGTVGQVLTGEASLPDLLNVAITREPAAGLRVDFLEKVLQNEDRPA